MSTIRPCWCNWEKDSTKSECPAPGKLQEVPNYTLAMYPTNFSVSFTTGSAHNNTLLCLRYRMFVRIGDLSREYPTRRIMSPFTQIFFSFSHFLGTSFAGGVLTQLLGGCKGRTYAKIPQSLDSVKCHCHPPL